MHEGPVEGHRPLGGLPRDSTHYPVVRDDLLQDPTGKEPLRAVSDVGTWR